MYPLFETIKVVNREVAHLIWHQRRFEKSYEIYYGKNPGVQLQDLICLPNDLDKNLYKLRITFNHSQYKLEYRPYTSQVINSLKLVTDDEITYSLKYSNRKNLAALLEQKEDCDEIIIVKNGFLTDTSFSNIALFDGADWYTPRVPLLKGTCRERLLFEKKIKEQDIRPKDIKNYQYLTLINAMRESLDNDPIEIKHISY